MDPSDELLVFLHARTPSISTAASIRRSDYVELGLKSEHDLVFLLSELESRGLIAKPTWSMRTGDHVQEWLCKLTYSGRNRVSVLRPISDEAPNTDSSDHSGSSDTTSGRTTSSSTTFSSMTGAILSTSRSDNLEWDVFVSHASEDKEEFARPLAQALKDRGLRVWFDEFTLRVGDSLRRSIDKGLRSSRYGVVVISPAFLNKEWSQKELDGLIAREMDGRKVILPVWHNIDAATLRRHSPLLADRLATSSSKGLEQAVSELLEAVN